jgi:hypothetical protein
MKREKIPTICGINMRALPLMILIMLLAQGVGGQPVSDEIFDTGFRPEVNGFAFENWKSDASSTGMNPNGMQRMFGDSVCTSTAGGRCILSPPAQAWMNEANKAMAYGHCEGMAVLSTLLYSGRVAPNSFGSTQASQLSFQNEVLQREIAYWWTTQVTYPGNSRRVKDSPNVVLNTLIDAFKNGRNVTEWWTLGLYRLDGDGGHAITPFAVQNNSNGTAKILVYDNNFPGATRAVEINRTENTWWYQASVNPNATQSLYSGDESTKSLEIVAIPLRLQKQVCEFCDNGSTNISNTKGAILGGDRVQFWADGNASILVTDKNGQRTGLLSSGDFVNEIPNANVTFLKFLDDPGGVHHAPVITTIDNGQSSGSVTGTGDGGRMDLVLIGPYFFAQAQGMELDAGEVTYLDVAHTGNVLDMMLSTENLGSARTVNLVLGIKTPTESFTFTIQSASIQQGGTLSLHLDLDQGTFSFSTNGNRNPGQLVIIIERTETVTGKSRTFANGEYRLNPNDKVTIYLNNAIENTYSAVVENNGRTTLLTLKDDPSLHPTEDEIGSEGIGGVEPDEVQETGGFPTEKYRLIVYINRDEKQGPV